MNDIVCAVRWNSDVGPWHLFPLPMYITQAMKYGELQLVGIQQGSMSYI